MIRAKYRILMIMIIIWQVVQPLHAISQDLSDLSFSSASVLPIFSRCGTTYLILAREAYDDRGMYDDFGGGREANENQPLITAAREFFEEGMLQDSLGLTLCQVQNYISNPKNNYYTIVFEKRKNKNTVIYLTKFDDHYLTLLKNFYTARKKQTKKSFKEKDRIAIVKWNVLKKTLQKNKKVKKIKVIAWEIHPKNGTLCKKNIRLRPSLVRNLRPFILNNSYKEGSDKKIRFYQKE